MKKIINGKMYNTETAEKLTSWEHSYRSQVDWYEEMLYKKKTGEYFLYGMVMPEVSMQERQVRIVILLMRQLFLLPKARQDV